LQLDPPHELRFKGPFKEVVTSYLKLVNPSERRVAFKVKTTAPKRYCVRPNSGLLEPNCSISIAVMLQPFEYDANEKNKHKFMVQTMFAPAGGNTDNQDTLWREAAPDQLMDSKLKCVFEVPPEMSGQSNLEVSSTTPQSEETAHTPPPKVTAKVETGDMTSKLDYMKAGEELKKLREDVSRLTRDNIRLQEESRRAARDSAPTAPSVHLEPLAPGISNMYLVIALVCMLLGLVVGKFFV